MTERTQLSVIQTATGCLIFLYVYICCYILSLLKLVISPIQQFYRYVIIVNYLINIFSINLQINLRLIVLTINCSSFQVSNLLRTQYVILASFTLHHKLVSHYLVAIERLYKNHLKLHQLFKLLLILETIYKSCPLCCSCRYSRIFSSTSFYSWGSICSQTNIQSRQTFKKLEFWTMHSKGHNRQFPIKFSISCQK